MFDRQEYLHEAKRMVAKAIGRHSYFLGLPESANGYSPLSDEWQSWRDGYELGKSDEEMHKLSDQRRADELERTKDCFVPPKEIDNA